MAKYDALTTHLRARSESVVTLTFDELDALIGGLPASGRKYQAYWANSARSQPRARAWLDAGRRARFDPVGQCVHFSLAASSLASTSPVVRPSQSPSPAVAVSKQPRVGLVGCVKSKGAQPAAARDLYTSAMFRGRRAFVEQSCERWFVLSSKYGLVEPDEVIEPYDVTLKDQPTVARERWAAAVIEELERHLGPLGRYDFEIHAGSAYRNHGLVDALRRAGSSVSIPTEGMTQGEQLAFYTTRTDLGSASQTVTTTRRESPSELLPTFSSRVGWRGRIAGALERAAMAVRGTGTGPSNAPSSPDASPANGAAVAARLLEYGRQRALAPLQLAATEEANRFLAEDAFAFLVAVICDQGIRAERAWAAPFELRRRIGHWELERIADEPDSIAAAFARRPALHRMVEKVPWWISHAAQTVLDDYAGDAAAIWNDEPTAEELRQRLDAFEGIGQKKAAMAVEILERDLGVPLRRLDGSDIAYDVHVRRVFLRSGIATVDDVAHMVAVARRLHPARPGELDSPAWAIGREWCRPTDPMCGECPLTDVCPRLISRAGHVRGM
jgi:uncharacterized HhH-GPD family protein